MMAPAEDQSRLALTEALTEVRREHDEGGARNAWRSNMLQAFSKYCQSIGVPHELWFVPLQTMINETVDATIKAAFASEGIKGAPLVPLAKAQPKCFAAAAVTVLKKRGDYSNVAEAIRDISRRTGIESKALKHFRLNLLSFNTWEGHTNGYRLMVTKMNDWPREEINEALGTIREFVK